MEKGIKKSVVVNGSLDEVWLKWTSHEGLKSFFGVDNKIELKLGGAFEIYFLMDQPDGLKGSEDCKIISFLPKEMLSFTWNAPPQFPTIRNNAYKTWVVINLKAIDKNNTEVILNHVGWLKGEDWNAVREYFTTAWEAVLNWLKESCK